MPFLIPLLVLLFAGSAVAAAVVASRRAPGGTISATAIRTINGTKVLNIDVQPAKRLLSLPPIPASPLLTGISVERQAKQFLQNNKPQMVTWKGCNKWKWGFCVDELIGTATRAQGAAVVAGIMEWIGSFSGLDAITRLLCFRFEWKLHQFEDDDGENWYPFSEPAVPLSAYYTPEFWDEVREQFTPEYSKAMEDQGHRRVVFRTVDFGGVDGAVMAYFIDAKIMWVLGRTTDIRRALQEDRLNISDVNSASCGGSWSLSTRKKALAVFS